MKSKLDPFLDEIIKRYNNGETSKEISKDYNIYPGRVIAVLKSAGVTIRGNHQRKGNLSWNRGKVLTLEEKAEYSQSLFDNGDVSTLCEATVRSHAKKILLSKHGNVCSICNRCEWNSHPIPLVCDHIDGVSSNYELNNFRLVCCNCDALLPTYKSKNRGKGRAYDRTYYHNNRK
jgi:hypothetical protein